MQHSGKQNSCPICGRDSSDHCRFDLNEGVIFCYRGVSHGPPDLRIGETLDVGGVVYAYVKDQAGFAGNSALFRVHEERAGGSAPVRYSDKLKRAADAMQQVDQFQQDAELADHAHRLITDLPLYDGLKPDEIRQALALCRDGTALLKSLVGRAYRLRRCSPDVEPVAQRMKSALREISHQQKDLTSFWHQVLLDPGAGRGQRLAQQLQRERGQ